MLKSLLFSVVLMGCLMCGALPAGAEGETRTEASPAAEELYRGIMQRLDAMESRLETQSQMKAHIDEAMQRLDEKTDRQLSFITAGFDALALMAALLGFAGFVIAVVTGKMYWQNIRRYQEDLKRLLAEARRYHKSMREMLASHSPSEKFAAPVLKQAEEAAVSGVGSEVLWGKAVLAQQEERWKDALVYWQGVLEFFPKDENALFGASLAAVEMGKDAEGEEQQRLWKDAEEYFQAFPENKRTVAVWCNWGNLCAYRGKAASKDQEREYWYREAEKKFFRATKINPGAAVAWSNWGTLCAYQGKAASKDQEREHWYGEAEEKFRRATEADPRYASGWYNWACVASLRHDVKTCVECLERWRFCNPEASAADLDRDEDFDAVRQEPEFLALRARLEK